MGPFGSVFGFQVACEENRSLTVSFTFSLSPCLSEKENISSQDSFRIPKPVSTELRAHLSPDASEALRGSQPPKPFLTKTSFSVITKTEEPQSLWGGEGLACCCCCGGGGLVWEPRTTNDKSFMALSSTLRRQAAPGCCPSPSLCFYACLLRTLIIGAQVS